MRHVALFWCVLFFSSPLSVPLGRRSTHWFCTKPDKASVIRWPRRMSQVGEKVFPEQIMMSHVGIMHACTHMEVLQGTKRSVKESSDKSKKSSPQMGSLSPESARQRPELLLSWRTWTIWGYQPTAGIMLSVAEATDPLKRANLGIVGAGAVPGCSAQSYPELGAEASSTEHQRGCPGRPL